MHVGSWLSINGEAIYKTKPWHYQNDTLNNNFWYSYNKTNTHCDVIIHMNYSQVHLSSRYWSCVWHSHSEIPAYCDAWEYKTKNRL